VARVWPGSLGSRVENRALAQSSLAEDHRDLTECLTTEDVRRPLSPFDARVQVNTAAGCSYGCQGPVKRCWAACLVVPGTRAMAAQVA